MKVFLKFLLILTFFHFDAISSDLIKKNPTIVSSINPIYQIALAIVGESTEVDLIIKPEISAHDYQIKKSDLEKIVAADLVFYVDDKFEQNFANLIRKQGYQYKSYKVSDIEGLKILKRRDKSDKIDSHIWFDLGNAVVIADFIAEKLLLIDEKNSKKYQKNLANFKQNIKSLETEIREKVSEIGELQKSGLVFYHDGYQYFEDYFDITPSKIMSYDHHKDLSIKDVREFDRLAKTQKIKCVIGDLHDEKNSAKSLAKKYDVKFVEVGLIGTKDQSYFDLISEVANKIATCAN